MLVAAPVAVRALTATYSKPYLAHASIGPSCAIAAIENGVLRRPAKLTTLPVCGLSDLIQRLNLGR
jgi:hypothetical protein